MIKKLIFYLNDEKNTFNKLIPFFILLLFILLNVTIIFNIYHREQKNNNIFRLHVVANSNSLDDQIIKLKVNEKINKYIDDLSKDAEITVNNITSNVDDILKISNTILNENNTNYSASLNLGKINYEKKESILLDMDKGNYSSIQIILGDGNGKNIWTLISPSKENIYKIKELNTILPGLDKLYNKDNTDKQKDNIKIDYDLKFLELYEKIKEKL